MDFSDEDIDHACRVARDLIGHRCEPGSPASMEYAFFIGAEEPEKFSVEIAGCQDHFDEWLTRLIDEKVVSRAYDIGRAIKTDDQGRILLWRAMLVPGSWFEGEISERPIGVCWAWDPAFAIAHNAQGHEREDVIDLTLTCVADHEAVDWPMTLGLNAAEDYTVGEEREIRLKNNGIVELVEAKTGRFRSDMHPHPDFRPGLRVGAGHVIEIEDMLAFSA